MADTEKKTEVQRKASLISGFQPRTDLAVEEQESCEEESGKLRGVRVREWQHGKRRIHLTEVAILDGNGAKAMGKPVGTYLTLEAPELAREDESYHQEASAELADDAAGTEADAAVNAELDESDAEMAGSVINAGYQSGDPMTWPVRGEIVMDYSMDATTWYPTLQEYKCNPSILIQSEEGTDVAAAFEGTVTDVYNDVRLGNVVEMSLGNGYEASYGQLENVDVAVGDTISQGEVIGEVSQPTRYYSVEGSHLNFMLTQDGNPVDPLDYLD